MENTGSNNSCNSGYVDPRSSCSFNNYVGRCVGCTDNLKGGSGENRRTILCNKKPRSMQPSLSNRSTFMNKTNKSSSEALLNYCLLVKKSAGKSFLIHIDLGAQGTYFFVSSRIRETIQTDFRLVVGLRAASPVCLKRRRLKARITTHSAMNAFPIFEIKCFQRL